MLGKGLSSCSFLLSHSKNIFQTSEVVSSSFLCLFYMPMEGSGTPIYGLSTCRYNFVCAAG